MYNYLATLTMNDASSIAGNSAPDDGGGGVFNLGGTVRMLGTSSIQGNAAARGGGIHSDGGTEVGIVCAPAPDANVHDNSPDDCSGG